MLLDITNNQTVQNCENCGSSSSVKFFKRYSLKLCSFCAEDLNGISGKSRKKK